MDVQRYPLGLNQLLQSKTGQPPPITEERLNLGIDLLQFYGLQQRVLLTGGVVNQTGGQVNQLLLSANNASFTQRWVMLFAAQYTVVQAGAMTALTISIGIKRGGPAGTGVGAGFIYPAAQVASIFTNAATYTCPFVPHYPLLLAPGWDIAGLLDSLVGVANAVTSINADVGMLE